MLVYPTKACPTNEEEWNDRSTAIKCTTNRTYMCLPNKNFTELLEFCNTYPQFLISKGNEARKLKVIHEAILHVHLSIAYVIFRQITTTCTYDYNDNENKSYILFYLRFTQKLN